LRANLLASQAAEVLSAKPAGEVIVCANTIDHDARARIMAGGNKQRGYILKEDASSPTVSNEAVMLTCVIDADENRDIAIVDIPNAFVQTVVEDEKDRAFIRIRGPLVGILMTIAPDVYGEYVTIGRKGEKQLLVQCLNALYGTMVASLLYYKKCWRNPLGPIPMLVFVR
jgi:hypothetical protein